MKAAINVRWIVLLLLMGVSAAAEGASSELMAQGSSERFWVARVTSGKAGEQRTTIFLRPKSEQDWRGFADLGVGITGTASRGGQLAVLLPRGEWMFVAGDGKASTGSPLPNASRLLALAGSDDTLWAVGLVTAKPAASTSTPSSSASSTATSVVNVESPAKTQPVAGIPATTQIAPRLMLFQLKGDWTAITDLPPSIDPADGRRITLSVLNGLPVVAAPQGARSVVLFGWQGGAGWSQIATAQSPFDPAELRLLDGTPRPVLWSESADGAASLTYFGEGEPKRVDLPQLAPPGRNRAAAYANGLVRVVWEQADKLVEQSYDPMSGASFAPEPRELPQPPMNQTVHFWLQSVITAALAFAIVASLRHRKEIQKISMDPQAIPLAPLGRRLLAGLVDALPLLVTLAVLYGRARLGYGKFSEQTVVIAVTAAVLVYMLHTLSFEMLTGRSPGKMLLGLRVVGLDGSRAEPGAVVVRNLLRIIDLAVVPLVLVLYSPLRQRAADVAAGTLVVTNDAQFTPQDTQEQELVETGAREE